MSCYKWPSDWFALKMDFKRYFDFPIGDIYDSFMSWCLGRFVIDIKSLDDILHSKFGEYEELGKSMEDILKENYRKEGIELLNELL